MKTNTTPSTFDHVTDPKLRAILNGELNLTLKRLLYACQHTMASHLEDEDLLESGELEPSSYEARDAAITEFVQDSAWPEPRNRWDVRMAAIRKYWLS